MARWILLLLFVLAVPCVAQDEKAAQLVKPDCKPWETVMGSYPPQGYLRCVSCRADSRPKQEALRYWCETDGNKGFPRGFDIVRHFMNHGGKNTELSYWGVEFSKELFLSGDCAVHAADVDLKNINNITPYKTQYDYRLIVSTCGEDWINIKLSRRGKRKRSSIGPVSGNLFALQPHRFWDTPNILLHSFNTATKIADFHSTERMLRRGGHELNPLLRNRPARIGIILGFGTVGHALIAWIFHKTGHHKLERWLMVPSIGASGAAAGWNYWRF